MKTCATLRFNFFNCIVFTNRVDSQMSGLLRKILRLIFLAENFQMHVNYLTVKMYKEQVKVARNIKRGKSYE